MRHLRALLPLLVFGVFLLVPHAAEAATSNFFGPIFPAECNCPGGAPDWGCVLATIQNLINFAISIGTVIFTLVAAYSGILLMASSVNAENKSKAKSMFESTVIGLLIMLSAWVGIDFVMKVLYNPGAGGGGAPQFGPWNSILAENAGAKCLVKRDPPAAVDGTVVTPVNPGQNGGAPSSGPGASADMCPGTGCVALAPQVTCVASGCQVALLLKNQLASLAANASFAVTEAYPESIHHCAVCQTDGRCVDVGLRPATYTAESVRSFQQKASAAGLQADFESNNQNLITQLQSAGATNVHYFPQVTGSHFSVYGSWGSEGSTHGANGATGCS